MEKDEEIVEGKGGCSYYKMREISPKRWAKPTMKVGGGHQTLRFGGTFSREKGELLSLEFYLGP